jgi:hypothetical protein
MHAVSTTPLPDVPAKRIGDSAVANHNDHCLVLEHGRLVLKPGNFALWWALASLAAIPIAILIARQFADDIMLMVGLTLLCLAGAGGFLFAHVSLKRKGLRAVFDPACREVLVSGTHNFLFGEESVKPRVYAFDEVRAVQCLDGRGIAPFNACQVNLVFERKGLQRVCLLDNAGHRALPKMAEQIAAFIGVPYLCQPAEPPHSRGNR